MSYTITEEIKSASGEVLGVITKVVQGTAPEVKKAESFAEKIVEEVESEVKGLVAKVRGKKASASA